MMKLIPIFFATTTFIASFVGSAFAQRPSVQITGVAYGGSGCPAGSARVNMSPNGQALTLLFSNKFAALGSNAAESRKSCNLSIPIRVPQGYQISLYDAQYWGYVAPQTQGILRSEYFFAGGRGPVFSRTLTGRTTYNVRDSLATMANVWSRCGDSVNMRVNTSIIARGRGTATVSRVDYHLRYRACR